MTNKNYYYYIEQINSLNILEKITYDLVMFQKSPYFIKMYNESQETKDTSDEKINSVETIAEKFSIAKEDVSLLKKAFIFLKPELAKSIDAYLFDLKIATSFGLGIGSLIPSVMTALDKNQISITKENAILLAVGIMMGIIYTKQKEIENAKKILKKVLTEIRNNKLDKFISIIKVIAKKLWIPFDKFLEFLAYTMMAIPFATFLTNFLGQTEFDVKTATISLKGFALAGAIQILKNTAPKLLSGFNKYFKRRGNKYD